MVYYRIRTGKAACNSYLAAACYMKIFKELQVAEVVNETADTRSLVLKPLGDRDAVSWEAGQFLTFVFPHTLGEDRRSYSISSVPCLEEPLCITVKRIPNGAWSRVLTDEIRPGDRLLTIGASGFFTLPRDPCQYRQYLFFAAGSGITPVIALISTLLHRYPDIPVTLIYSNRSAGDTIFYRQLQQLQARFGDRFRIEFLFSSSKFLGRARLSKWLMEQLLPEYRLCPPEQAMHYTCGPYEYMRMVTIALTDDGVPAAQIRKEDFQPLQLVPKELPPDTDPHQLSLELAGQEYTLRVQYPDTILKAAQKAGIPMPYSCEAGRCGTCVARCDSGKVWMSYNEVLLDEEIAAGRVLTCTGYLVGGDARLRV